MIVVVMMLVVADAAVEQSGQNSSHHRANFSKENIRKIKIDVDNSDRDGGYGGCAFDGAEGSRVKSKKITSWVSIT